MSTNVMIQVADTIAAISDASKHSPMSGGGSSVSLLVLQLHSSWTINSRIVSPLVNTYQLSSYLITRVLIFRATVSRLHALSTLLILTLWILDVTCCHDGHGHCHFIGLISLPLPATPPQIKRGCLAGSTGQRSRVFSSTRNVGFSVILSNQSPRKTFHSTASFSPVRFISFQIMSFVSSFVPMSATLDLVGTCFVASLSSSMAC